MFCPKCKTEIKYLPKSYACDCTTVWKEIAGRRITEMLAAALFQNGETEVLDGFRSKVGKLFRAALVLEGGKVVFRYPDSQDTERHPEQTGPPTTTEHSRAQALSNGAVDTLPIRIESRSSGTVSLDVTGIINDSISYGLVPSRQAECLGCITAVNLVKHSINPLPKLEISLNSMEFARYLLREHVPRNAEVRHALEYLWKLLAEFPGWSAEHEPKKKARLQGSPQSNEFPKGIFPGIMVEIEAQGESLRVALPNSPDIQAQFIASIRKAEKAEDGAYMIPKNAESVLKAWIASVDNANMRDK